jgi:transposase
VHITIATLLCWAAKYGENGLEALRNQPCLGRPVEIDNTQRAKIMVLACSIPPEGYAQWNLRLPAAKAVELEYCEHISHTEVGRC